ncbi:TPA: protein translocase subunit SecF, partial [Staphylococcus aureus]|nr:protein translocase subunit SecF [Staphylococcus aureus]
FGVKKNKRHDINEGVDVHDLKTSFEKWNFVKLAKPLIGVSILIVVVGLVILYIFKLNLGIDFSSGTRVDFQSKQAITQQKVEQVVKDSGLKADQIQINGKDNKVATVQFKDDLTRAQDNKLSDNIKSKFGDTPQINTVSPIIGQELAKNAMLALIYASIGIIIYVSLRFEWRMGLSSVLALLHDVFIIVAIFSLFRIEVDLTFIAAVLTIVGYSINDTIVTFDRVRENLQKVKVITTTEQIDDIVNRSIRQTMTRSINTVLTVIVVVVAILFFGAPTIFNFTLALFIGLISGVFSSIFIAVPLWGIMKKRQLKKSPKHKLVVYKEKKSNDEKILV